LALLRFVDIKDTGLDKYLSSSNLNKIKRFKKLYISSSEIGILTKTHRTHVLNLVRSYKIKPAKVLPYWSKTINFYDRKLF